MKTLFTLVFLGVALSGAAQTSISESELAHNATTISRVMAKKLQLNEQEYIQIKSLTLEKLRTVNEIIENYAYNPTLRSLKLEEAENAYQRQIRHALSARQVEQYLARHEEAESVLTSMPLE
ncbi:hypothetical protein I5M27_11695 [Adhaeribacter sp. BT258]|uniref:DUF4168 domain-containing protein n=1 Tax=Adhaeribacter terrigena TaxID=2793070 RepID=A0ABS1C2Q7_9BACT|nr:hypothetical protein [Adhaeribacter terrigena]MBK0403652.1 hypothetical protein [Adhaeribacter terrigena]